MQRLLSHSPNRIKLSLLFCFCLTSTFAQQIPQYTQFMFNNMIINPATAGADGVGTVNLFNRSQWSGVEGAPSTLGLSANARIKDKNVGLGISFIHDKIGVHKNTTILLNYAYHVKLSQNTTVSMGLQGGILSMRADYTSLAHAAGDPKTANVINNTTFDLGAGVNLRGKQWQLGVAVPSLISRSVQVNDSVTVAFENLSVLGSARYRFALNDSWDLEPGVLVKYFPDVPMSIDINALVSYRKVIDAGVSFRMKESVAFLMRLQLTRQLQLAYSYDFPLFDAALLSSSSHEFMLQYQFKKATKRYISPR